MAGVDMDGAAENPYQAPVGSGGWGEKPFRDMKGLILVMGILAMVAGLGFGCLGGVYGFLMPVVLSQVPEEAGGGMAFQGEGMGSMMAGMGLMMACVAVALVWLGVGTVRMKRWAGDLFLAGGWLSGSVLAVSIASTAFFLPQLMEGMMAEMARVEGGGDEESRRTMEVTMAVAMAVMFGMYLVPPLAVILVFRLKSVKQTLAHYDRGPSWTEGMAQPVLVWWVWLVGMGVGMVALAPGTGSFYQLAGVVEKGWQAGVVMGVMGLVAGLCAWGVGGKKGWSWAASLVYALVLAAISVPLLSRMDLRTYYENAGMSEEQLRLMGVAHGDGSMYTIPAMAMMGGVVIFLLVTRKYFRFGADAEAEGRA